MKAVEDGLRRLDGVDHVSTDLQANIVTIVPRRDVAFPFGSVPEAITRIGYRPGRMWIEARGRFVTHADGSFSFVFAGWASGPRVSGNHVKGDRLTAEVLADGSLRVE